MNETIGSPEFRGLGSTIYHAPGLQKAKESYSRAIESGLIVSLLCHAERGEASLTISAAGDDGNGQGFFGSAALRSE
jgi:hypothetical protein